MSVHVPFEAWIVSHYTELTLVLSAAAVFGAVITGIVVRWALRTEALRRASAVRDEAD
jgi:hypothetical protein